MTPEQQKLLTLWNKREQRFTKKVADLKAKRGGPESVILDLINAEAKLAELKECRHEFKIAFGLD